MSHPIQFIFLVNSLGVLTVSKFRQHFLLVQHVKSHCSALNQLFQLQSLEITEEIVNATNQLVLFLRHFIEHSIKTSLCPGQVSTLLIVAEIFSHINKVPTTLFFDVMRNFLPYSERKSESVTFPSFFSLICNFQAPLLPCYLHKEFTLVLDLDETLGHFEAGRFWKRPGVELFLHEMHKVYEIVLFTAANTEYAEWAMQVVDPEGLVFLRIYGEQIGEDEVKDLGKLGRDLEKVIIIDNFAKAFQKNPLNGIEILSWLGDPKDQELNKLIKVLASIPLEKNVRLHQVLDSINKKH
jgi:hypothetical protein